MTVTKIVEAPPQTQTQTWRARWYRDDDKDSLLRLSAFHYGKKDQAREGYFDWLYSDGPAGRPHVVVAEDMRTGDIIAFTWHVPRFVQVAGTTRRAYLGCNGLVHPEYRRQGVYLRLHDVVYPAMMDGLFIYGFPKPVAVYPLTKMGHFEVGRVTLLARPLNIDLLTKTSLSNRALRLAVNLGWQVAGTTIWRPHRSKSIFGDLKLATAPEFDDRFDRFWQRVAGKYDIMVRHDRDFLTWRFASTDFRSYETLTVEGNDGLVGYLVFRLTKVDGISTGVIMDLLVEPGERGDAAGLLLIEEATRRFQAAGMAMGTSLTLRHTHECAILRRAGYVECPERLAPQPFRLTSFLLSADTPADWFRPAHRWFVTLADHDAL